MPQSLVDELVAGRLVPFVGSGVSLSVGSGVFPTWPQLLDDMAERLQRDGRQDESQIVGLFRKTGKLYEAAQQAWLELGKASFNAVMRERFQIDRPADADLSLVEAIWRLEPSVVVTTNYDSVLRWTEARAELVMNHQTAELLELYRSTPDAPRIWHLHGHISHADSLILAAAHYEAFYRESPAQRQRYEAALVQLRALAANYSLLFIGFSLEDKYVMNMLGQVLTTFAGNLRPSYALLRAGEGEAAELWRKHRIRTIEFEDFGDPQLAVLREMAGRMQTAKSAPTAPGMAQPSRGKPIVPPAYIESLQQDCGDVDLLGLRVKHGQAVRLNHVYVPQTTLKLERGAVEGIRLGSGKDNVGLELLLNLLDNESLYISGAPGSGKSTFCRWVAWLASAGHMPSHDVQSSGEFAERFPDALRDRLPLLIRLREFWNQLPMTPGCDVLTWSEFEAVLRRWFEQKEFAGLTWPVVRDHLQAGSALVILDGVDEVPLSEATGGDACRPRAMMLAGVSAAAKRWTERGNRVLVTSRPYGLGDADIERLGLRQAPLADLPEPIQRLLVRRWFHCLRDNPTDGQSLAAEMSAHVAERPDISPLAANPMLLTAMCIIYNEGKRLPQDKHDLYQRITETVLCNRYPNDPVEVEKVRNRLSVIAHGMHTGYGLDEQRQTPQATVTHDEIDRMIKRYRADSPGIERTVVGAVQTREDLLTRSGLLLPRGDLTAAFYHFTFQDYLAAQRLLDLKEGDIGQLLALFRQRGDVPEWRNTLSALFGSLLAKSTSSDRGIRLLSSLLDALQPETVRLAVVTADCLEILQGRGSTLDAARESAFRDYCLSAIEREVPVKQRLEIGLALGRLGDPRVADDVRDARNWVEIPAGTYLIGDAKKPYDIATPFWIGRYPVTNAQFRAFIEAGGYLERKWWSDEGWQWRKQVDATEPHYWRNARWNGPTQPVVGVSYWEAEAFARWAGGRLPKADESEAAARGPAGHEYAWEGPWEDGICNSGETGLEVTSPVGLFPRARSADFHIEDMTGNVWEWCSERVLRGGAWYGNAGDCRAADRHGFVPGNRDSSVGFRVLCSRQNSL
ncbi:MAG: SUMF1/EgtB/PvdO family nonheme iron enzyme [Planctomycetota bacterium]|nr:SUMF1/EgtB/PvdO family nonheme iron enzyme [Planctomycetota bacterium]